MHDNQNGVIAALCQSYDQKYVFSVGADGNIFMYEWEPCRSQPVGAPPPMVTLPQPVPDITDPTEFSLEQKKQNENRLRHQAYIDDIVCSKDERLGDLRIIFSRLKEQNKRLPVSVRIAPADLLLDERISDNLRNEIMERDEQLKRTIQFDVEKTKLQLKKLKHFFIDILDDSVISVTGIR